MAVKGIVYDIQKFSLHDGPGIRTTVFLKGCPLRCLWCHNPESWSPTPQLSFNKEKCKNCMTCVDACPTNTHKNIKGVHVVDHCLCELNLECVNSCPYGALRIYGEKMSVEDVIEEVIKDYDYYHNSGGGLTVSGGEPMYQYEFTKRLLKKAKQNGIHTCIETSGFATTEKFIEIDRYVDLYLYDYKFTDLDEHKKYTGVSNQLILDNLTYLYNIGSDIVLRCPLIPGINDIESHLKGIAKISQKHPGLKSVEVMAYHNMGNSKACQIGEEFRLPDIENTDQKIKNKWTKKLKEYGCNNVKIG